MQGSGRKRPLLVGAYLNILLLAGFTILAGGILCVPLQHYMPLGRYQHYGIAIFVFGLGYLVQGIINWPGIQTLAKCGYMLTTVFFCSIGFLFMTNPWLDLRMCTTGDEQTMLRYNILSGYGVAGLFVVSLWLVLAVKELRQSLKRKQK
jgi:hypothetical protein